MGDARGRRRGARAAPVAGAIAVATLVAVGSTGALSSTACATHACDGDFVDHDSRGMFTGHMLDDDTWESNGLDEQWFDFPGQRTLSFQTPALAGRTPVEMLAYISTADFPNAGPDNYTLASGNVVEFLNNRGGYFFAKNDTCGHYTLRVVVRVAHRADAGASDADASPLDAAPDAPQDAARD